MTINTATATMADLKAAETAELLRVYNKITGRNTKKFSDRKTAEQQTWNAIQRLAPEENIDKPVKALKAPKLVETKPEKKKAAPKKEGRKRMMRFCFAPGAQKTLRLPRPGSLRMQLFELLRRDNGILFSEIFKEFPKWHKQNIYEAIRLIHFSTNYGMWSTEENGDIRIKLVMEIQTYRELVAEAKAA